MSTTEELSDIVNGSWADSVKGQAPKRNKGLLERLASLEAVQRYILGIVVFDSLRSIGVPTDDLLKVSEHLLGLVFH
jgi:hypothetical protein